jgi:hypothetical protein
MRLRLNCASAEVHSLAANEEVAGSALRWCWTACRGDAQSQTSRACRRGELVSVRGTRGGIRMRVVAGANGAKVATWPYKIFLGHRRLPVGGR